MVYVTVNNSVPVVFVATYRLLRECDGARLTYNAGVWDWMRCGELGLLNCDDVCHDQCPLNKSVQSSSSLFLSPFMLTCSMMRFLSLLLLGLCACVVFVVQW